MNFGKTLIVLITLFAVLGTFSFASSLALVSAADNSSGGNSGEGTWITSTSNVYITAMTATIKLTIKNTKDHVQYFKISQTYTGSLADNSTIKWTVDQADTNPTADWMIDNTNNGSNPDLGWKIQPGETKTVCFTLRSKENSFVIVPLNTVDNTYWPVIPDFGITASWFMPNEIEMLNPSLDLQSWKGTFTFTASNFGSSETVEGIIRAPIVPSDSLLTYSDPKATFIDEDIALNTNVAAWDASFPQNVGRTFTYIYEWPIQGGSSNGTIGNGSSNTIPTTSATNATTVPSRTTGVPYGLLAIAVMIVAAGLGYAKFLR